MSEELLTPQSPSSASEGLLTPQSSSPASEELPTPQLSSSNSGPPISATKATTSASKFRIFDLPAELRLQIWDRILEPTPTNNVSWVDRDWFAVEEIDPDDDAAAATSSTIHLSYKWEHTALMLTCRQIYDEAASRFWRRHVFVRIDSPWPDAERHIALQGHVPIVATGARAQRFEKVHMVVTIAPAYFPLAQDPCNIILLERDLAAFGAMWFHSHLTYPGLNAHLRLTFRLDEPHLDPARRQDHGDGRYLPAEHLQRRLIEPFGRVKDLNAVCFEGDVSGAVETSLRAAMALPAPDPGACLLRATDLRDQGDAALKARRPADAAHLYERAFAAMFIVSSGRRRTVWGEAYFQGTMESGRYAGTSQNMVRLLLRTHLVAGMVAAHAAMGRWADARFWGMRTIRIMREHMGVADDEAVRDFVAADAMGRVYHGTGLACHALGNEVQARTLLRVAAQYLPNDATVQCDSQRAEEGTLKVAQGGELLARREQQSNGEHRSEEQQADEL